uniref:Uncharacterized protein n=1 Tax=Rhizophora mucronata TaxID=61149 RepID=A0A2P2QW33_RHIMU
MLSSRPFRIWHLSKSLELVCAKSNFGGDTPGCSTRNQAGQ